MLSISFVFTFVHGSVLILLMSMIAWRTVTYINLQLEAKEGLNDVTLAGFKVVGSTKCEIPLTANLILVKISSVCLSLTYLNGALQLVAPLSLPITLQSQITFVEGIFIEFH